jgi:hypothetical protein
VFAGEQPVQIGRMRSHIRARELVGLRHLVTPYAAN